jgi:hypothetical protein
MNVFALIARKRTERVHVPRETLWTRTNRYHKNASGSVEGSAKTAVPQRPEGAALPPLPPILSQSQ